VFCALLPTAGAVQITSLTSLQETNQKVFELLSALLSIQNKRKLNIHTVWGMKNYLKYPSTCILTLILKIK
jgi:hypothetical protein